MTEVKISKMEQARVIFNEVFARGYDLQGKTQRAVFIERAMAEIPMSKHGAGTYYQNLSNQANGQKLYKYNKPAKKKTVAEVREAEAQIVALLQHLPKERWMVVDESGQEVNNFNSRAKAMDFAKVNGYKWADRNKAA
jgi:hypothetical protein